MLYTLIFEVVDSLVRKLLRIFAEVLTYAALPIRLLDFLLLVAFLGV